MKTYKLNNVEVSEGELRALIKNHPNLLKEERVKCKYYFPKGFEAGYYFDSFGLQRFSHITRSDVGMFETPEEAKLAYDKQCAIVRCWKWAQENAPFEPDWKDSAQQKWVTAFNHDLQKLKAYEHTIQQEQFTLPYFATIQQCSDFIKANRADLVLLFLK